LEAEDFCCDAAAVEAEEAGEMEGGFGGRLCDGHDVSSESVSAVLGIDVEKNAATLREDESDVLPLDIMCQELEIMLKSECGQIYIVYCMEYMLEIKMELLDSSAFAIAGLRPGSGLRIEA